MPKIFSSINCLTNGQLQGLKKEVKFLRNHIQRNKNFVESERERKRNIM